jgi:polysaccharide export outer membrane protein
LIKAALPALACAILLAGASRSFAQARREPPKQYQPPATTQSNETAAPGVIVSPGEDYRIGPSDVIEISIEDAPELSRLFRVSADGTIVMPFIGRVTAKDQTPHDLAATIAARLRGEYLHDPQVSVMVKQINSHTYFIQGAVRRPGLCQIEGRPSLSQAGSTITTARRPSLSARRSRPIRPSTSC